MTFEDAIKKSIKAFMSGKMPLKVASLKEDGLFYTPEYFDELEVELLEEPTDTKKAKEEDLENEV